MSEMNETYSREKFDKTSKKLKSDKWTLKFSTFSGPSKVPGFIAEEIKGLQAELKAMKEEAASEASELNAEYDRLVDEVDEKAKDVNIDPEELAAAAQRLVEFREKNLE